MSKIDRIKEEVVFVTSVVVWVNQAAIKRFKELEKE